MNQECELKAKELATLLSKKLAAKSAADIFIMLYNAYLEGYQDAMKIKETKIVVPN